jgi:hypothetical protein
MISSSHFLSICFSNLEKQFSVHCIWLSSLRSPDALFGLAQALCLSNVTTMLLLFQVLALGYYTISYFPGGSSGLKFLSSSLLSPVSRIFG